jgi:hypothetical protein
MAKIKRRKSQPLRISENETKFIKTFHIKYDKKLSPIAKLVLNNLQNKYLYYAIEDILSLCKSRPVERDIILSILYSPLLCLQNHFSINFFNIWIKDIYINETSKFNKFLNNKNSSSASFNYITIKFYYRVKPSTTKTTTLW